MSGDATVCAWLRDPHSQRSQARPLFLPKAAGRSPGHGTTRRASARPRPRIISGAGRERLTLERCFIRQLWGLPADGTFSVARARVRPGVTTAWHALAGTSEWYLVFSGTGRVEVGRARPRRVGPGDLVFIPPNTRQRITNVGRRELIFYCLCHPAFSPSCYQNGERPHPRHKRVAL